MTYIAGAVHFPDDGAVKLTNNALTAPDTSFLSVVYFYKQQSGNVHDLVPARSLSGFWATDPAGVYASYSEVDFPNDTALPPSSNAVQFSVGDPAGNFLVSNNSASYFAPTQNVWHCYMVSIDVSSAGVANVGHVYLDDNDLSAGTNPGGPGVGGSTSTIIAGNGVPLWVGSINEQSAAFDMANFFMWYGTAIDFSVQANRRKFVDGSGYAVDPADAIAAFGTPTVLLAGDAAAFVTNQGNGGAFSLTGVLTTATTAPNAPSASHTVAKITRLSVDGYGVRRYLSFANKAGTIVVPPVVETVADALGGTTSMGTGGFSRKKWKKLLEEIRQQLADEQTSLKVAKKQEPDSIDYAARAARVAAIHDRALVLEAKAAAQSQDAAAASVARFADKVARIEAQYQAALAIENANQEDEDDVLMLVMAA